jgi:hypothetical protein
MRWNRAWLLAGMLCTLAGVAEAEASGPSAFSNADNGALAEDRVARIEQSIGHLDRARQRAARGDTPAAAAEIREAAALAGETARVGEREGPALEDAGASLRSLADDVERGAVTTVEQIDRAAVRADLALVSLLAAVAVEAWAGQATVTAGRALDAAVGELEDAAARTGQVLDDVTAAALGRARWFAGRLVNDTAAVPDDFRQASEGVTAALDSLTECFAVGAVSSPLGPAGPRTARPDTDLRCR